MKPVKTNRRWRPWVLSTTVRVAQGVGRQARCHNSLQHRNACEVCRFEKAAVHFSGASLGAAQSICATVRSHHLEIPTVQRIAHGRWLRQVLPEIWISLVDLTRPVWVRPAPLMCTVFSLDFIFLPRRAKLTAVAPNASPCAIMTDFGSLRSCHSTDTSRCDIKVSFPRG